MHVRTFGRSVSSITPSSGLGRCAESQVQEAEEWGASGQEYGAPLRRLPTPTPRSRAFVSPRTSEVKAAAEASLGVRVLKAVAVRVFLARDRPTGSF